MATFNTQSLKNVDVVEVNGRVDSSNADDFDNVLKELMQARRYKLVLDLSGVTYMSSAALRAIVSALRNCKKNKGDVYIASPSERVQEVLSLAGLETVFNIYDDKLTAVGNF